METSVKERLTTFIKYKGMTVSKFENIIGVSNGYISNMRQSIQPDKVRSIVLNYPELNIGWLMTGIGNMLNKPSSAHTVISVGDITNTSGHGNIGKSQVGGAELTSLKAENEHLKELLKAKDEQIESFKMIIDLLKK